ncbi:uncharacterized protein L969DRAFT_93087 [Mixia osmundae IAM 14324]|uniref:C2H2-type domain-containing protein n=1 Tax=Mixia osmundae (strain CBS 9802 / IAM 14324 / JCM 22182 / KY 12970) TaxID=764103 RepID=G7E653_MIXOS|nr:uncharacterized protein L969DRAFT_93087 [Mixia osmundae IAM 14324]KEI40533.1 hypothetical protein L969DRAFT_93087 [Mixia osmundae IAM 14324]GAA98313.1 hypothetical protein E5Q_04998 [Mixia osmundae IAM 14324]
MIASGSVSAMEARQASANSAKKRRRVTKHTDSGAPKKFACDWQGCDKVFSRPDHLSRHRLNHEPVHIYRCERCPKTFVRADLLTRHVERHDKRDLLAESGESPQRGRVRQRRKMTRQDTRAQRPSQTARQPSEGTSNERDSDDDHTSDEMDSPDLQTSMHSAANALLQGRSQYEPSNGSYLPSAIQAPRDPNRLPPLASAMSSLPSYPSPPPGAHYAYHPIAGQSEFYGYTPASRSPFSMSHPLSHSVYGPGTSQHAQSPSSMSYSSPRSASILQPPRPSSVEQSYYSGHQHSQSVGSDRPSPASLANASYVLDIQRPPSATRGTLASLLLPTPGAAVHEERTKLHQSSTNLPHRTVSASTGEAASPPVPARQSHGLHPQGSPVVSYPSPGYGAAQSNVRSAHSPLAQQQLDSNANAFRIQPERSDSANSVLTGETAFAGFPGISDQMMESMISTANIAASTNGNLSQNPRMSFEAPFFSAQDYQWLFDGMQGFQDPPGFISSAPTSVEHSRTSPALQGTSTPLLPPEIAQVPEPEPEKVPGAIMAGPPPPTPIKRAPPFKTEPGVPPDDRTDATSLISERTYNKIIDHLDDVKFAANAFSPAAATDYLTLFWTNFSEAQCPLLHRPTFRPCEAHPALLCAMISIGAYCAGPEALETARAIHTKQRVRILSSPGFKPRADLWFIQASILCIIFGKLCGSRLDHEMAHVHWGSLMTVYRRSSLFSPRIVAVEPGYLQNDLDGRWRTWIEEESRKRCAFYVFALDISHSAIFRHTPSLSAFQIQLTLPCFEDEWIAPTAEIWEPMNQAAVAPPAFISALKSSLKAGLTAGPLSPSARVAVLHGLLSITFDLNWRDHFLLGLDQVDAPQKEWRETISSALNAWKARLDSALLTATYPSNAILRGSIPIYAISHTTLAIDCHQLQIFAGAQSALGLAVPGQVIEATRVSVVTWAHSRDGRAACWHAAHFLRSTLMHHNQGLFALSSSLYHVWAVYLCALVVYAYGVSTAASAGDAKSLANANRVEDALVYLDAMCTNSPEELLKVSIGSNCLGLIAAVWKIVRESKWDIAQEAARLLQRIVRPAPSSRRTLT